jgi:anti-sigma B factor antagonist
MAAPASQSTYLSVRRVAGVTIARILREKVGDFESDIIRNEAVAAIVANTPRLAIDLEEVQLLTSAGIGALITIDRECKSKKGKMAVFNVAPELLTILKMTKMDRVFAIHRDEGSAAAAIA